MIEEEGFASGKSDTLQALTRGLQVIRSFDRNRPMQTITEIADATRIPKGSVQRILFTLAELGYAECLNDRWQLTPAVMDFGVAYVAGRGVYAAVQTHLERLGRSTDQIVSLGQLADSDIVYMLRVEPMRFRTSGLSVGSRLPAVFTAIGRVLLSELSEDELRNVLATPPRSAFRPPHEMGGAEIRAELDVTRKRGWGFSGESILGSLRALAAPVTDHTGRVVAAISMTVSVLEMDADEMIDRYREPVLATARRCSEDWARILQLPIGPNGSTDDQIRVQTVLQP